MRSKNITKRNPDIYVINDSLPKNTGLLVMGIDEAGRGPVIGPMIICGFILESIMVPHLIKLGLRDSKELSPNTRKRLYSELIKIPAFILIGELWPEIIDNWLRSGKNLNELEAYIAAKMITIATSKYSNLRYIFIDAPSTEKSFMNHLKKFLTPTILNSGNIRIFAEEKADKKRPIVSAASIIAKNIRDERIKLISKITGIEVGSGYPSDPRTRNALKLLLSKHPQFIRKSWKTVKELKDY